MIKLIGRYEEQRELASVLNSDKAEFVVVYGRRRIGKTFLIEQFFKSKKCLFFHVTGVQDGLLKEQLAEFSKGIGKTFHGGATLATPKTWMKALDELNNAINKLVKSQKIIIFIDELPWMATKRSRLLQALDYYWNHYWSKNPGIKLIVCGSSASWIIKNIIYNKGGLHNRYTCSLLIKPFSLHEVREFLKSRNFNLDNKQILQLYMMIGGIPHYLDKIKKGLSIAQNVEQLCFRETGILFNEFEKLFKSLFDDARIYIELVRIVATRQEGVSRAYIEKQGKFSRKGGVLTDRLNDLEQAGFIKSFLPISHQRQGIYYRVIDEYTWFYLKCIEPEKRSLLSSETDYWLHKMNSPVWYSLMGYSFESVCYKHIAQIQKALKIPSGSRAGTWRYDPKGVMNENGAQIDLLFERNDDAVTVCEIKCTNQPFVIDKRYWQSLLNKIGVYKKITKTSRQIFLAFISASGIKKNGWSKAIDGVVTLDDLFVN